MQDPNHPRSESPVNAVPPTVVVLFLAIVLIEGAFSLGRAGVIGGPTAVGWRLAALQDYAFFPGYLSFLLETGRLDPQALLRFVSYPFVHGAFQEAVISGIMLLALGKFVGEVMRPVPLLAHFLLTSICGALAFGLVAPDGQPLYGAFVPAYGFIGAYSYMLWVYLGAAGERQIQAFRMIGILMAIQLLFAVFVDVGLGWVAELTGFFVGFLLAPLLLPGGLMRLRQYLQRR